MLKGVIVGLRPIQMDDAWILMKWFSDPQVSKHLGLKNWMPAISLEQELQILQRKAARVDERSFIIWDLHKDVPIGLAEISDIDPRNANALMFVMIGEKDHLEGEFAEEATKLILRIAFDNLNLHRVYTKVGFNDTGAVERLFRLGFSSEGFLRDDHYSDGSYHDSHLLGMLVAEFRSG
jgi:ribosomal-protein-alanine N-acetyltransferase